MSDEAARRAGRESVQNNTQMPLHPDLAIQRQIEDAAAHERNKT